MNKGKKVEFSKALMYWIIALGLFLVTWRLVATKSDDGGKAKIAHLANNQPVANNQPAVVPSAPAPAFQLVSDAEKVPHPVTIHVGHNWSPVVYSKSWGYFHWESEIGVDHWMSINGGKPVLVHAGEKYTSSVPTSNIRWCLADSAPNQSVDFTYWNELDHSRVVSQTAMVPQPSSRPIMIRKGNWTAIVKPTPGSKPGWDVPKNVSYWYSINHGEKVYVPAGAAIEIDVPIFDVRWCIADNSPVDEATIAYIELQ